MESIALSQGLSGAVDSRIGGRNENQDHYELADTPLGPLVVVCDGMGGGPAGKTASSMAARRIVSFMETVVPGESTATALADALRAANNAICDAVADNPPLRGMGTTCVCLLLCGKTAYIAHAGDSRCYLLRKGKIRFRTADHSQVADLVRQGILTEEQARLSSYSNIITRGIGIQQALEPEVDKVQVKKGDRFALMSDGIWGTMSEPILVAELTSSTAEAVVATLPERVDARGHRQGGGHDNMTLAVVDITSTTPSKAAKAVRVSPAPEVTEIDETAMPTPRVYGQRNRMPMIVAGLGTALLMGAVAVWLLVARCDGPSAASASSATSASTTAPASDSNVGGQHELQHTQTVTPPANTPAEPPVEISSDGPSDGTAVVKPSAPLDNKQLTADINVIDREKLSAALTTLDVLEDYTVAGERYSVKKKIPQKKRNERISFRKEFISVLLNQLKALKDSAPAQTKGKIADIAAYVTKNKDTMANVDKNFGHTTVEGKKAINECRTRLKSLWQ